MLWKLTILLGWTTMRMTISFQSPDFIVCSEAYPLRYRPILLGLLCQLLFDPESLLRGLQASQSHSKYVCPHCDRRRATYFLHKKFYEATKVKGCASSSSSDKPHHRECPPCPAAHGCYAREGCGRPQPESVCLRVQKRSCRVL